MARNKIGPAKYTHTRTHTATMCMYSHGHPSGNTHSETFSYVATHTHTDTSAEIYNTFAQMYSHNTLYAPHCIAPGAGLPLCSVLCLLFLLFVLHPHHLLLPVHLACSAAEERHNYPAGDAQTSIHIHTLGDGSLHTLIFGDPRRSLLLFVTTGASLECVCVYVCVLMHGAFGCYPDVFFSL